MLKEEHLRQAGLKVTGPRLKILAMLERQPSQHWRAEAIYAELQQAGEDVSLATIYRVLTQFEQAGLLIRHHFGSDGSVFELEHGEHHDHMVCIACGTIHEFVDDVIEQRQTMLAKQQRFMMTDHRLTIYGYCASCQHQHPGKQGDEHAS